MRKLSSLKGSAALALLSYPFWFILGRYGEELHLHRRRSSASNLETPETLVMASVMALISFGFFLFTLRERPRKP